MSLVLTVWVYCENMLTGGSIGVLHTAREDWTPSEELPPTSNTDAHEFSTKVKGDRDNDTLDSDQQLQADWIRRYMEQQEEVLFS